MHSAFYGKINLRKKLERNFDKIDEEKKTPESREKSCL